MQEIKMLLTGSQKYLIVLLVFIVLDMVSGVIKAILDKELKSSEFRNGLLKKCLELIIVVLAYCLAWCCGVEELGLGTTICLVMMEGYSILENISTYVPIPSTLKEFIEKSKGENA